MRNYVTYWGLIGYFVLWRIGELIGRAIYEGWKG